MASSGFRLHGMRQVQVLLAGGPKEIKRDMDERLRRVAEPIRADAESLAVSSIRRIGPTWSRMRVGVTRTVVYVAPRAKGTRGPGPRRRPKFATVLEERAMGPALRRNEANIETNVGDEFAEFAARWNRL